MMKKLWYSLREMAPDFATLVTACATTYYSLTELSKGNSDWKMLTLSLVFCVGGLSSFVFLIARIGGKYHRYQYGAAQKNTYLANLLNDVDIVDVFEEQVEWWDSKLAGVVATKSGTFFVKSLKIFEERNPAAYATLARSESMDLREWGHRELRALLSTSQDHESRYILTGPSDRAVYTWATKGRVTQYESTGSPFVAIARDFHQVMRVVHDRADGLRMPLGYWRVLVDEQGVSGPQKSLAQVFLTDEGVLRYRGLGLSRKGTRAEFRWDSTLAAFFPEGPDPRLLFYTEPGRVERLENGDDGIANLGIIKFTNPVLVDQDGRKVRKVRRGSGSFFDLKERDGTFEKHAVIDLYRADHVSDRTFSGLFDAQLANISKALIALIALSEKENENND